MTATEAIRILTKAGYTVTRTRKNAPGYKWAHDYKINGEDVTLGRLRREAEALGPELLQDMLECRH